MRNLILRAFVWMMVTIFATMLLGRFYFRNFRMKESEKQVSLLLDVCLDDLLVSLEQVPVSERPGILREQPPFDQIAWIEERSALPEMLQPTLINERPIWASGGDFWIGLSGEQLLLIRPIPLTVDDGDGPPALLGAVLSMAMLASVIIIAPVARRVSRLTRASRRVAQGALDTRVNDPTRDAVGELARQFDAMTESIEQQQREREAFFRAVAHELSTPLSRMELALELMETASKDEDRQRRIDALHVEIEELSELTAELLNWVQEERGRLLEPVDVDIIASIDDLLVRNRREGVRLSRVGDAEAVAELEERAFQRAIDNIIRNAVRYAHAEVRVTVTVSDSVDITIEDDGPGIALADRVRIFEPFTRLDPSRDRRSGGAGLGLSIVKRILDRHNGRVWVSHSADLGGAAFVLRWPTAAQRD